MKNSRNWALLGICAISLSSCATAAFRAAKIELSDAGFEGSALLLGARFAGAPEGTQLGKCTADFQELDSGARYEVQFAPSDRLVLIELDPGLYQARELRCALYRSWDIRTLFPEPVAVEAGKISFAGDFTFRFGEKAQSLALVPSPRQETLRVLREAHSQLPSVRRSSLLSGSTRRPISAAMLVGEAQGELRISATQFEGQPKANLSGLTAQLARCNDDPGFSNDRVRAGRILLTANYETASGNPEISADFKNSALAPSFEACLRNTLTAYRPGSKLRLQVSF
jgi:hypothetical protein